MWRAKVIAGAHVAADAAETTWKLSHPTLGWLNELNPNPVIDYSAVASNVCNIYLSSSEMEHILSKYNKNLNE